MSMQRLTARHPGRQAHKLPDLGDGYEFKDVHAGRLRVGRGDRRNPRPAGTSTSPWRDRKGYDPHAEQDETGAGRKVALPPPKSPPPGYRETIALTRRSARERLRRSAPPTDHRLPRGRRPASPARTS